MNKLILAVLTTLGSSAQARNALEVWSFDDDKAITPFKTIDVGVQGAWAQSNAVQIKLTTPGVWLRINRGEFEINNDGFSSAPRWLQNGDVVRMRVVANSAWHQLSTATLLVSDKSLTFSAKLADTSPDPFTFTAQSDVARSTTIYSNTITISGIDSATPISITGGYYSINGGAYTQASGSLTNGQTLQVYVMSSANYNASSSASITVGDYTTSFTVTTAAYDAGTGGYGSGSGSGGGYGGGGTLSCLFVPSLLFIAWWRKKLHRAKAR